MRSPLSRLGLAAFLTIATLSAAEAGERFGPGASFGGHHGVGRLGYPGAAYAGPYGYGYGGYGFADAAVGGAYIGAPYTRFPRPNEIVPPAWGYGTYGVPTATGIRQAPAADPTVYVIDSPAPRRAVQSRVFSRGSDGHWVEPSAAPGGSSGGARVVSVTAPGR